MPNRNSSNLKELAEHLLAYETSRRDGEAVFRICEKLRLSLIKSMGVAGFRALFSRAVALAGANVPWLRELPIRADGSLEGLAELEARLTAEQIGTGEVALVAELLGLLVTFIGPALTLQLLQDAWPRADFSAVHFD
jgi:hypothetical protein